jgi:hypothetical protein
LARARLSALAAQALFSSASGVADAVPEEMRCTFRGRPLSLRVSLVGADFGADRVRAGVDFLLAAVGYFAAVGLFTVAALSLAFRSSAPPSPPIRLKDSRLLGTL